MVIYLIFTVLQCTVKTAQTGCTASANTWEVQRERGEYPIRTTPSLHLMMNPYRKIHPCSPLFASGENISTLTATLSQIHASAVKKKWNNIPELRHRPTEILQNHLFPCLRAPWVCCGCTLPKISILIFQQWSEIYRNSYSFLRGLPTMPCQSQGDTLPRAQRLSDLNGLSDDQWKLALSTSSLVSSNYTERIVLTLYSL